MMHTLTTLLARVRRYWMRMAALRVFTRQAGAAALVFALAGATERWLPLGDGVALLLAIVALALVVAATVAIVWPLRVKPDDRRIARFIEERVPSLEDSVVTAVDLQRRSAGAGSASDFSALVVAQAARRLEAIDPAQLFDRGDIRRAAWHAAAAGAAVAIGFVIVFPLGQRAAQVAYLKLMPSSVSVRVSPGNMRVPAGRPATIVANVTARHGTLTRIAPRITIDTGGQRTTLPMAPSRDGYRLQIKNVERSFSYAVSAGPATSSTYSVTALHPARVQRVELQYDYPSFTGLKPRVERDGGDVYGPAGTRVRLVVHADKPVTSGNLAFSQGRPAAALAKVDDRTLAVSMTLEGEAAYRVALVDPDGLASESVEYFVRVMDDRPPEVHIMRPSGDEPITPLQEVPIEARADDDFGIAKLEMVYSVGGGAEKVVPFTKFTGTEIAKIGSRMLAAEDLKVKPGDVIAYYARAWDVPHAKRSTMTRSEIFFLEVTPFNEEYSLAMSQAGMQASTGTQLDGLISAQKEIISATWNLERRAAAGRSATDIKGVADAQAELKTRAEKTAGSPQQRRGFGRQFLQIVAPGPQAPSGNDPVTKAVEAMGKALQQLETQKTGDAIPHEMAALNALLQAQAEIRQKQITQGTQSAGGGWGNRQGAGDLSSLFDRELKRQQKTNYENKAGADTPPETKGESALDKIKDLARRQEELNRKQRDLSKSGLTEDEMKRQLEKLTREQEELRRQAEDAAKQMGQNGQAQQDMKSALDQMREAASDGQKQDANGAASKGQQAADALRRAEGQMQNGSSDAQKRALGDLQLESQQIAQEQRRVANEAERLDREGGGTSDARRRLAAEKDRLADRVDALQQSAQRLPSASEAARDLSSQQLAERMRSGSQSLRDANGKGRTAPAEQQIADALDRVARKIGGTDAGGAKGDTKQLANQLDDVRDARERIARLEREMRDAQQQAEKTTSNGTTSNGTTANGKTENAGTESGKTGNGRAANGKTESGKTGNGKATGNRGDGDVARLQEQLNQELQRTRQLLDRLQQGSPQNGNGTSTPEGHEWSRSAPGTEAFKQDYKAWQSLASDVTKALERAESSTASRLSNALAKDRLRAGGSERVPDAYRKQVSKYFESIATKKGGS